MNSIALIGRLTTEPELHTAATGTVVCTLRLAVPQRRRHGEDQQALFIDAVSFGAQAEAAGKYLIKGQQVAVSGRLESRSWTTPEGEPRSACT
jgi:single-strand DNA-binding protein